MRQHNRGCGRRSYERDPSLAGTGLYGQHGRDGDPGGGGDGEDLAPATRAPTATPPIGTRSSSTSILADGNHGPGRKVLALSLRLP